RFRHVFVPGSGDRSVQWPIAHRPSPVTSARLPRMKSRHVSRGLPVSTGRRAASAWAAGLAVAVAAASVLTAQQPASIDDAALRKAASSEQWLTYGLDQSETRFSPLTDINAGNVKELGLSWAFDVGLGGG